MQHHDKTGKFVGLPLKAIQQMRDDYLNSELMVKEICAKFNIDQSTLYKHCKDLPKFRTTSETRKLFYAKGKFFSRNKGKTHEELYGKEKAIEMKKKNIEAHLGNIPWNKGKTGSIIPWNKGKKGMQQAWNKGKTGLQVAWNKGIKGSVKPNKTSFKKGQVPWIKGKKGVTKSWNKGKHGIYPEKTLQKIRDARLKQVFPFKDTIIEVLMQTEIRNRNIPFQTHFPILGQPDIVIQNGHNFAIFCDGCYWHNCSRCFPNGGDKSKNTDLRVNDYLQSHGWIVLRFWEHDIKNNLQECVNKIEEAINDKAGREHD